MMLNEQPLVSVGIPAYNRPDGLGRTLECITHQIYTNLEIIVSDNCSPNPKVEQVVKSFMADDPRIQYFRQPENKGAFFNFYFVLEQASGEFFMWAADDDQWQPDFIEKLLEPFIKYKNVVLSCCNYSVHNYVTGEISPRHFPKEIFSARFSIFQNAVRMFTLGSPSFCYGIYDIKVLKGILFKHITKIFDFSDLFLLNAISLMGKIHYTDEALYIAGITTREYEAKTLSQKKLPFLKFGYSPFFWKNIQAILTSKHLRFSEKRILLSISLLKVLSIIFSYEDCLKPHHKYFHKFIRTMGRKYERKAFAVKS